MLQNLTTMQVIEKHSRLFDLRAQYRCQNLDPPDELLADIDLLGQVILAHFELIANYSKFYNNSIYG